MNRLEDYITCTQAAWLMGTSIRQVQGLAQKSKLNRIKKEDRVLIEVDSIVNFAYQKIKKYERAVQYFKNQDKVQDWKNVECHIQMFSDVKGYLSMPQAAYILNSSREGVRLMVKREALEAIISKVGKVDRTLISEESIEKYVNGILEKYYSDFKNLFEYIDCENKDKYWMECEGIIQKNYTDVESKRRQYYKKSYVRKEKNKWESSTKN